MKKIWTKFALIAGLAGCGELAEDQAFTKVGAGLAAIVLTTQSDSGSTEAATASEGLTRAAIDAAPVNLLRLSLISGGATDILAEVGRNGTKVTWSNQEGFGFTFDDGLLISTRRTGHDLMGADVTAAKRSLSNGGNHTRLLDFLDSLDQIQQISVQCETVVTGQEAITIFDQTYQTSRIEETCSGAGQEFKNIYWRDRNGVIWQSQQWISPQVGYLGYQRL